MTAKGEPQVYRIGSDRLFLWIGALSITSYVLDGPLRFALHSFSAEMALYSRDALAFLAVGLTTASWALGQGNALPGVIALAILLVHCAIGVVNLPTTFQALIGLKVFLSFLLGFALAPLLQRYPQRLLTLAKLAFVTTALGVVLNLFVEYPWIGLSYETSLGTTEASKQWWQSGTLRLPGFARVSFNAATYMLVALVPLLAVRGGSAYRAVLVVMAGGVFVLTTTKGAWSGLLALLVDATLVYRLGLTRLANTVLVMLAAICLGLPVVAVQMGATSDGIPEWLVSFMERVGDMWPRAFALWNGPWQVFLGRGLGGIGVAQPFGEWLKANAADNLMVYLLVSFGLCGLGYVGLFLLRLLPHLGASSSDDFILRCARGWTVVWLAFGFTTNMIEEPVMNIAIGVVFGLAFEMAQAKRTLAQSEPSSWGKARPASGAIGA